MARSLTAFALVGLLLFGMLSIGIAAGFDTQQIGPDDNTTATISVSGSGEASAQPDQALVFVSVTATADNSQTAAEQLATETERLRANLSDRETIANIRTTDFRIDQVRDNETTRFVARQSFELRVNDTEAAGDVVDAAVAAGATEINNVAFTLSRERQQEIRETAIDRAVDDARNRADAVANSTDLTVGDIRSISTDSGGFSPTAVEAADAGGGTVIDPGPVSVDANVQITYSANDV